MANSISSFFQTLVAAASEASQVLVGTTALIDAVYTDFKPEAASIGQTLNIAIPASVTASVADNGAADPVFTDISSTTKPIILDKHAQFGGKVRDWEQYNFPTDIRNLIIDPALKGVAEYINAQLAALLTSGNFNVNAVVSTTGSAITPAQFLTGQAELIASKVPVQDSDNMSFLVGGNIWTNILQNTAWTQESIAGVRSAEEARRQGNLRLAYGSKLGYDQQLPSTGTTPSRTFTSVNMHKFAIGLAVRPLPKPGSKVVDYTYVNWKGVPIRVSLGYSIERSGYLVNVEAGFGLAVVRPEMGVLFSTAE